MHYTAGNFKSSLEELTEGPVSSHYLVPEGPMDNQRKVFELVPEVERAWHAGVSAWQDRSNLNDTSIGVEIVNLGYKDEAGKRTWFPFPDYQVETVIELAKDIVDRYKIEPTRVVGHGDIAPGRKVDPGPVFPWKKLYENGIGAWFDDGTKNDAENTLNNNITPDTVDILWVQKNMRTYGYPIEITGQLDKQTTEVIMEFQMHFRPSNFSGVPDAETCAILHALVSKYYPKEALLLEEVYSSKQEICSSMVISSNADALFSLTAHWSRDKSIEDESCMAPMPSPMR